MTAQSRALGISEILDLIFGYVPHEPQFAISPPRPQGEYSVHRDDGFVRRHYVEPPLTSTFALFEDPPVSVVLPTNAGRSTLLAAALSCRRFTSSALAILWRTMDSLGPLLSLLPIVDHCGQHILASNIAPETWARFDLYRNLVRVLTLSRGSQHIIGGKWYLDAVWTIVIVLKPVPLPCLHTLIIPVFDNTVPLKSFSPFLTSPHLQHLQVGKVADRGPFIAFCSLIQHVGQRRLQSIAIGSDLLVKNLNLIITPELRSLRVRLVIKTTPSHMLSNLPSLRHLHLWIAGEVDSGRVLLPSLESLHLSGTRESVSGFLSSCVCDLQALFITLPPDWNLPDRPGDTPKLLLQIVANKWPYSLRHFEIDCTTHRRPSNDLWGNFMETIQPIMDLPLLTLRFLNSLFKLGSDVPIITLASHFRQIQSIFLPPSEGLTFSELYKLAVDSPQLQHLGVSVNLQGDQPQPSINHGLKTLHVLKSRLVGPPENIALGLDRIFPTLTKIESLLSESKGDKWHEVERFLGLYHRARDRL
ncbi:hypothetical protein BDN72DRAFT_963062 [Pluteus cervinus]|uniref:Uncharacterized protein n=1 Tax=Pluteus cervinus TaxID=181527 RepID=A0ACD3AIJ3_9AGAR|nr:hypothetical protein BDN72DRAFT_963062 [Pluteus cervinus]